MVNIWIKILLLIFIFSICGYSLYQAYQAKKKLDEITEKGIENYDEINNLIKGKNNDERRI